MNKNEKTKMKYSHVCSCAKKLELANYQKALSNMGFTLSEFHQIIDFYLLRAPIMQSSSNKRTLFKKFSDYGYQKTDEIKRLKKDLLEVAQMTNCVFLKSDTIEKTLEQMNLKNRICFNHPRAVLLQNCKVIMSEKGTMIPNPKETQLECLFRHIRNSIAHSSTYYFENDMVLLEDKDNNKITARILIKKETFLKWKNIIEKNIEKDVEENAEKLSKEKNEKEFVAI